MGLYEGEDPLGVARFIGPKGPANGFTQEKFLGGHMGQDGRFQEVDIKVFAVKDLSDNGTAVEPHVGVVDPSFEYGADLRWVALQKGTDGVRGQKVHTVPPGFCQDQGLDPRQVFRRELAFKFADEVQSHHLVFPFGQSPQGLTGGLKFRFWRQIGALKEGFGQRSPKRLFEPQKGKQTLHISGHSQGIFFNALMFKAMNEFFYP